MKRILILIACIAAFTFAGAQTDRSKPPEPAPAKKIQLEDYQTFKLKNGLTVILVENHELPTVSFTLQLALMPVLESNAAGTASLAGQLLRSGTTTRTKSQLDEEIDFIGASINTSEAGIFGSSLKKHQEKVLDLMADILFHPVFPEDEFNKLKKQTLSALAMSSSDPNAIAGIVANVLRYGKDHPYGEAVTEETVNNITVEGVRDFYNTYFKPDIAYLIMVGDLKLAEGRKLAEKYFSAWESGKVVFRDFSEPAQPDGNLVAFVDKPGAVQSVVTITNTFILKPGDPDILPATLMNTILGGGVFSGRLMMNLREDKAYTYGATSSLRSDKLIGHFTAGAQVGTNVTDSAIREFLFEIRRMRNELVSEDDIRMNKNVMAGEFARALESPSTMAAFALNTIRYNLPVNYYATYLERLEKITAAEIQAMAKKYLQPDNCIILVVGNKEQAAGKLSAFSGSGAVAFYDRYGNLMENKTLELPEGLTASQVINQYLKAIGGEQSLKAIRQITTLATGRIEAMGQKVELSMKTFQLAPDRVYQEMKMGGMVVSRQVYNGTEGWITAMGKTQDLKDTELAEMRDGAQLFPELLYFSAGYQTVLEGVENVEGRQAYRLKVVYPSGTADIEYYDAGSGFKIRKISRKEAQGQTMESISDYADYREIGGVWFPFSMKQQVAGQLIDIKVDSIDTTAKVDSGLFKK
jgi:zinc protease